MKRTQMLFRIWVRTIEYPAADNTSVIKETKTSVQVDGHNSMVHQMMVMLYFSYTCMQVGQVAVRG